MTGDNSEIKILLVDDNDDDVVLMTEAIEDCEGFGLLQVAVDGKQAIEYLKQEASEGGVRPDLVFIDANMPIMDGFQVLEAMKSDRALVTIPVVMMTSSDRFEDISKAYEIGVSTYVRKPFDFMELKNMTKMMCEYWRLASLVK